MAIGDVTNRVNTRSGPLFHSWQKRLIRDRYLFLLFIPPMLFYVVFHYAPMFGVMIAFKRFDFVLGVLRSPWAGSL